MSMKHRIQLRTEWTRHPYNSNPVWPVVIPKQTLLDSCKTWCKNVIGTNGWNYYGQYRKIPFEFRFKREEDLVAFKLKFGEHCVLDLEEDTV